MFFLSMIWELLVEDDLLASFILFFFFSPDLDIVTCLCLLRDWLLVVISFLDLLFFQSQLAFHSMAWNLHLCLYMHAYASKFWPCFWVFPWFKFSTSLPYIGRHSLTDEFSMAKCHLWVIKILHIPRTCHYASSRFVWLPQNWGPNWSRVLYRPKGCVWKRGFHCWRWS